MNENLKNIPLDMRELGLGALTHANRHAAYQDPVNDKWAELSVLQAAHAAEILIKARIAQEHPLLMFEKFPKTQDIKLSLETLFYEGNAIEWSQLPNRLWAITGLLIPDIKSFKDFGKIRNGVQHMGAVPKSLSESLETLKFIYSVIDPFINKCWGLYAIDYDEDFDSYENFLPTLINYEIKFLVSPDAAACHKIWDEGLKDCSTEYKNLIEKRIIEKLL